jgi:hypothetical protein
MVRQSLLGLPVGNKDLVVYNPMNDFKTLREKVAVEIRHLINHHIETLDQFTDDYPAKETSYNLCYIPLQLSELAKSILSRMETGEKYEKEVLAPRRRAEKLHKILGVIEMVTGVLFIASMAIGEAAAAIRAAIRAGTTPAMLPAEMAEIGALVGGIATRGTALVGSADAAAESAGLLGFAAGSFTTASIIAKEFPAEAKDVMLNFFAQLMLPIGMSYAVRAGGRVAPKGTQGGETAETVGSFRMARDADGMAFRLKSDLEKPGANPAVVEQMGVIEAKLRNGGLACKPKG